MTAVLPGGMLSSHQGTLAGPKVNSVPPKVLAATLWIVPVRGATITSGRDTAVGAAYQR